MSQQRSEGKDPRHPTGPKSSKNLEVSADNLTIPVRAPVSLNDSPVEETITDTFDRRTWEVTEAALAAHATLLIEGADPVGLMIVGPSGSGKTTAVRLFEDATATYRTDKVTPAAFVSHDASLTEEELAEVDLLPRVRHKTLVCRDMASWFAGPRDKIRESMATVASVMDGDGLVRSTGAHGERGYSGDFRFNFVGATTPLNHRAWEIMGHTGNRFLFHELPGNKSKSEVAADVFSKDEYHEKVRKCREVMSEFINDLWDAYEGYAGFDWEDVPPVPIQRTVTDFGELVAHARAPVDSGEPIIEGRHRVVASLRNFARGRALLDGRVSISESDLPVVARVALSTMPRKRRGLIRALVNPSLPDTLSTTDVTALLDVSEETAHSRMKLADTLGLGTYREGSGPNPHRITLADEFRWPENVPFPESFEKS
ncbi:MAG: hypothetical protein ABEH88_10460 [Halobacteriales archaeon]